MPDIVVKGRKLSAGKARGEAVVTGQPLGFSDCVDAATGVVVEKDHELAGVSLAGRILVYPGGRGATVDSFYLNEMARCGTAPAGIVNTIGDAAQVVGAIISNIPMIDQVDADSTELIQTGDSVELDSDQGTVRVTK